MEDTAIHTLLPGEYCPGVTFGMFYMRLRPLLRYRRYVTISSNGTHIMVDGRTVSNIHVNGTNFVSVTLANGYCVIKVGFPFM